MIDLKKIHKYSKAMTFKYKIIKKLTTKTIQKIIKKNIKVEIVYKMQCF